MPGCTASWGVPTVPAPLDCNCGSSSLGYSLKKWGLSYPTPLSWTQATTPCHKRHGSWVRLCLKEIRTADEHGLGMLLIEINTIKSGSSWHLYKGRCYSYSSCLVPRTPNSPQGDYWRSKVSLNQQQVASSTSKIQARPGISRGKVTVWRFLKQSCVPICSTQVCFITLYKHNEPTPLFSENYTMLLPV